MSDRALRERERRWRERGDLSSELAYREAAARAHGDDPRWLDDQARYEQLVRGPRASERVAELGDDPWVWARRSPLPGVWVLCGPSPGWLSATAERLELEPLAIWPRLRLRAAPGEVERVTQVKIQVCCPGTYAQLRLRVRADADPGVDFADASELPIEFKAIVRESLLAASAGQVVSPEAFAGRSGASEPKLGWSELRWVASGVAWQGLRLTVVAGRDHPVDSNARSFRAVSQRALALTVGELGPRVEGGDPSGPWQELEPTAALDARRAAYTSLSEELAA